MSPPYTLIDVPSGKSVDFNDIPNSFWIDMALMHNVLIRGCNSIYEKAPVVKPGDEIAFAGYCLTAVDMIHIHHRGEEKIFFPHLGKRLDMSENLREHEEFSGPLDAFHQYIKSVFDHQEKYDAEKTRALLRGFADFMSQHLHDEMPTIMPDQLNKFEKSELDVMMAEHGEYAKANGAFFTILPWCVSHHNTLDVPHWPPLPGPLMWLARNFSGFKYSSWWKFSPYDLKGKPRQY